MSLLRFLPGLPISHSHRIRAMLSAERCPFDSDSKTGLVCTLDQQLSFHDQPRSLCKAR